MYRPGKILTSGTWTDTDFPVEVPVGNRAAVLSLDQPTPAWHEAAPMKWARTYHTLTVLPDGDVLALGGQSVANANALRDSPVLQPEIWHPATDTWTSMASSVRPRGYHNTSLLLPDGRILLAGSGRLDGSLMTDETTAEVYSPPYLFKGPRPVIGAAPSTMEYGRHLVVETPDAARIDHVSLVRMGAVTHNFNMDQRWQELRFRRVGAQLEIDAPTSAAAAPPGVYYLFLIDDEGVPSKAAILSLFPPRAPTVDVVAPTVPEGVSAVVADGRVSVTWRASTDENGVARYIVHRSTQAGFTPGADTRVATVGSGASHTDEDLPPGTYRYRIVAEDAAGNASPASAEVAATVPAPAGPAGGGAGARRGRTSGRRGAGGSRGDARSGRLRGCARPSRHAGTGTAAAGRPRATRRRRASRVPRRCRLPRHGHRRGQAQDPDRGHDAHQADARLPLLGEHHAQRTPRRTRPAAARHRSTAGRRRNRASCLRRQGHVAREQAMRCTTCAE